ncbi:MAG: SGNH/GDSL hydrolase family protein [Christensenellales bacterium]|jgi:lysophospholipase L1-like esterase
MKKRILCFGDSNTWGYDVSGGRFPETVRWPMRLGALLGDGYTVIEEGFNGRTCVYDDPIEGGHKSGLAYLPPCVMSHSPLDLIAIMLGTNDCKKRFQMTPFTIGGGITALIKAARAYAYNADGLPPKILIMSPAPITENVMETRHADIFGADAPAVSRGLSAELQKVAKLMNCEFLDAGAFAEASKLDAVHLTREGHLRLAEAMRDKILDIL